VSESLNEPQREPRTSAAALRYSEYPREKLTRNQISEIAASFRYTGRLSAIPAGSVSASLFIAPLHCRMSAQPSTPPVRMTVPRFVARKGQERLSMVTAKGLLTDDRLPEWQQAIQYFTLSSGRHDDIEQINVVESDQCFDVRNDPVDVILRRRIACARAVAITHGGHVRADDMLPPLQMKLAEIAGSDQGNAHVWSLGHFDNARSSSMTFCVTASVPSLPPNSAVSISPRAKGRSTARSNARAVMRSDASSWRSSC